MVTTVPKAALTAVKSAHSTTRCLFEELAGGPLPGWDRFGPDLHTRTIKAGAPVFMQGAEHPFVYVVKSGLIKNLYLRVNGETWIKSFAQEGRFFASIAALKAGGRTSFSAVCIEDSELERFPFAALERLAQVNLVWATLLRRATMLFAERKEARERELLTLTPEDRYRAFVAESPGLEARVTQKDLAAYLGVTPVGLNRIVKRVTAGSGPGSRATPSSRVRSTR
jgi:CRP/FNR family transcriptional regulator